jgi:CspA family cold shock protein
MATGTVRFYNASKGFGLITPDTGGPALFANSVDLKGGVKKLAASQRVEFDVVQAATGTCACNIRMIG